MFSANQPNALISLRKFLGFVEKKVLINSYSNFKYCLLFQLRLDIFPCKVPKESRGFTEKGTSFSL